MFKDFYWTSELLMESNVKSPTAEEVESTLKILSTGWDNPWDQMTHRRYGPLSAVKKAQLMIDITQTSINLFQLLDFISYKKGETDFTGVLKGFAINRLILYYTERDDCKWYYISFGKDIVVHNFKSSVSNKYNDFGFDIKEGCVFTSGNDDSERGDHIVTKSINPYKTMTVILPIIDPLAADYWATTIYSDPTQINDVPGRVIAITKQNKTVVLK
jgi:hypothetical protein